MPQQPETGISQNAKDAFKAEPRSTGEFFTRTGEYFYIPVYQRPYAWKASDDIKRLFVDVTEGLSDLASAQPADALMFIGALILVEDRKKEQILPIVRDQVPAKVYIVIDGQQRCTTLLIWACALLERIALEVRALSKSEDPGVLRLVEMANSTARSLELMVHDDERGADPEYSYYPRVIRSHEDQWSKRRDEAKYTSPLAYILRCASEWIRAGKSGQIKYAISELPDSSRSDHDPVFRAWKFFSKRSEEFASGEEYETVVTPSALEMAGSTFFQEALWGNPWHVAVRDTVAGRCALSDRVYGHVVGLARTMALANFVLNRICFTAVRSERESWAFDVFDALNTTGQPLTAFETFRPTVIQDVGLPNYRQSEEFQLLERIQGFLTSASDKPDRKVKRTEKLIIHARVLESGEKLPKRLAAQRQWLRGHYLKLGRGAARKRFLGSLADLAEFTDIFSNPKQHLQLLREQQTILALFYLSETNHDIVVPVLSRFYSVAKAQREGADREEAFEDFRKVVRATTAFSTLWRLAHGGTEKIDDCFRCLMRGHELRGEARVGPYCAEPLSDGGVRRTLTSDAYKADLLAWLKFAGIDSEDAWLQKTVDRPSYEDAPQFARLFLAAAMHNAVPDPSRKGHLKRGNEGTCSMLSAEAPWTANEFDVEHVAPQAGRGSGWDESIYQADALKHSLGNLTLLPSPVNKAIKNWDWTRKRAVMRLLSSTSPDEVAQLRRELTELGTITEFPTLAEIVKDARFHGHLRAICEIEIWNRDAIRARGENICRMGYQQLMSWLGR